MRITHGKIPVFISVLSAICALTLAIHNGHAGSPVAAKISKRTPAGSSSGQWVWQNPLPQGNTLQDFFFIDPNNGFAVGARGTILRTTDGGNNWDILASGTDDDLYSVAFTDPNTGTVVGNFGAILTTTDAGNHWTIQRDGMADVLFGVSFTDADHGTAVGSDGLILRTTDGGANWINQASGTTSFLNDVSFTDTDNGTAVGDNGTILRTTNGGTNWVSQTSDTLITLTEFLSRMPIRAPLLDQTAPFSGRRMVGTIGPIRPVQSPPTFTTFLSEMQIPGQLLVLSA